MRQIAHRLFVGGQDDLGAPSRVATIRAYVQAAKQPFHQEACGYPPGKAAPKGDEYLVALRHDPERLILNMLDGDDPKWVHPDLSQKSLRFIHHHRSMDNNVLIHCNQGLSRSPSIAMLYLRRLGSMPDDFDEAMKRFLAIYPIFAPKGGVLGFMQQNWEACKTWELE